MSSSTSIRFTFKGSNYPNDLFKEKGKIPDTLCGVMHFYKNLLQNPYQAFRCGFPKLVVVMCTLVGDLIVIWAKNPVERYVELLTFVAFLDVWTPQRASAKNRITKPIE